MKKLKQKVIIICGPTASGKTDLSINIAEKINGEIVSADSMQIYKDMDIGTAKPSMEERKKIEHYMIDIINPDERYSVADFKCEAMKCIEKIVKKGKVPIVVGGTGLYIDSIYYGIEYNEIKTDLVYREKLEEIAKKEGLEKLYEKALEIDPIAIKKISKNDKKRIIRVLEIYHETGKTKTEQEAESIKKEKQYDYKIIAIDMDRKQLYERINKRVDMMIDQGLIEEVEKILKKYNTFPTAMQGLGYKEVVKYINNEYTKEEMIEKIKMESRRYAKRQITWFKRNKDIIWLNSSDKEKQMMEVLSKWMK